MGGQPRTLNNFQGVDNVNSPESIVTKERDQIASFLPEAINVDISRTGRVLRRSGFSLQTAGRYHSLWFEKGQGFVVKDYRLIALDQDLAETDLRAASDRFFSYADTDAGIYMSDGESMLRYRDDALVELTGVGTFDPTSSYLDPSEDPTIYDSPPPGNLVVWMFGRLWVAKDDAVFFSRGYLPDQFNSADDYLDQPGVTLLAPADAGFYIGTGDRVQYVASQNPKEPAKVSTVSRFGAVAGTQLILEDASVFGIDGADGPAVVWESEEGKILGLSGGRTIKMTENHVSYPAGDRGASIIRAVNGENFHTSSLTTKDNDSSNMRTTDTAVAEIRRNGIII